MMRKYSIWFFVLIVVLTPITVFGIVSWYQLHFQRLPVLGEKGHRIENFQMTNQSGNKVTLENWKGKIVVANFFFTHCPVICPKMTHNLNIVQQTFLSDDQFLINSFSVDPERDTVQRLDYYASQFHIQVHNWNLLTGDKMAIYRLARKSFLVVATDGDGGPTDFIHSDKLVLVDKQLRIRGYYDGTDPDDINKLMIDIRKLKREPANR